MILISKNEQKNTKEILFLREESIQSNNGENDSSNFNGNDIQKPIEPDKTLEIIDITTKVEFWLKQLLDENIEVRQLELLGLFAVNTLVIIFNTYNLVVFLLKTWYTPSEVKYSLHKLLFFYGYHIVDVIFELLMVVISYNIAFRTVKSAAVIIYEFTFYVTDDIFKTRLQQLWSLINNSNVYNIFGILSLDGSLILSIISTTITYIIILLQYHGQGDICQESLKQNATQP